MYLLKLNKGDTVPIFSDYKNDIGFQGNALLLEKLEQGDSFFEDYEQLRIVDLSNSSYGKKYSKQEIKNHNTWKELNHYFIDTKNPEMIEFASCMMKLVKKNPKSHNTMLEYLEYIREEFVHDKTHCINNVLSLDPKYVVRYFQQRRPDWAPTMFCYQKWLVEFPVQCDMKNGVLFNSPFRTTRRVRYLLKFLPTEKRKNNEVSRFTSYSSAIN